MRQGIEEATDKITDYAFALIGKNIKLYRQLSNYTQTDIANLLGVSKAYISALERGITTISIKQAILFAVLYNCKVGDLINTENLDGLKMMLEKDLKATRNQQDNNKTTEN